MNAFITTLFTIIWVIGLVGALVGVDEKASKAKSKATKVGIWIFFLSLFAFLHFAFDSIGIIAEWPTMKYILQMVDPFYVSGSWIVARYYVFNWDRPLYTIPFINIVLWVMQVLVESWIIVLIWYNI